MGTPFQDLSEQPDQTARIFRRFGLASSNEVPVITPLNGGVSSTILRVDLKEESYCLKQALPQLKVSKVWRAPLERVLSEVKWLQTVAGILPGAVPAVIGEDRETNSFVMNYLGNGFTNWKENLLSGVVDIAIASQVGTALGKIHTETAHNQAVATQFATDDTFHALRLEPYFIETARVHPALAPTLLQLVERTKNHRSALVHGDVSPKNILFSKEGPVFIDAECAWYGDPAFDVAFVLNHLLIKAMWLPHHTDALMESFDALRQAYFSHANFEPHDALDHRIATLLPALALARVDGKSPVEYLDDNARRQLRATALALCQHPCETLETLGHLWKNKVRHHDNH